MKNKDKLCLVDGCGSSARSRGYCAKHYKQVYRHGRITPEREQRGECIIPGCSKKHKARGYCAAHYREILAHGEIREKVFRHKLCSLVDCKARARSRGLCSHHYNHYLNRFVANGYSWDQVDRIIIRYNQKVLFLRNRLQLIKTRHQGTTKNHDAIEKEEILADILLDEEMDPEIFVEISKEEDFWLEELDEGSDLFQEELRDL
jgi:hypothetical protein